MVILLGRVWHGLSEAINERTANKSLATVLSRQAVIQKASLKDVIATL